MASNLATVLILKRSRRNTRGSNAVIVEFGHFALVLALLVAVFQMAVPALGARAGDGRMMVRVSPRR